MQERLGDVLGSAPGEPESDDEAFEQVRDRVQALISAARTLSDTCADLADALRPVPGMVADDPIVAGFGRLRAERTAALLDEAASAARGTLGLLYSAYGALDSQRARVGEGVPQTGAGTWPDAFVEVPSRAFTVDDEAGTAVEQMPWARPGSAAPDATDPHGIPAGSPTTEEPTDTAIAADEPAADEPVEDVLPGVEAGDEPAQDLSELDGVPEAGFETTGVADDGPSEPADAENIVADVAADDLAMGIGSAADEVGTPTGLATDGFVMGADDEPGAATDDGAVADDIAPGVAADGVGAPADEAVDGFAPGVAADGVGAPADEAVDGFAAGAAEDESGVAVDGSAVADDLDGAGAAEDAVEPVEDALDDGADVAGEVVAPGPPMEVTPLGLDEPDGGPDDLDGEGLRAWASPARGWGHRITPVEPTMDEIETADAETADIAEIGIAGSTADDLAVGSTVDEPAADGAVADEVAADEVAADGTVADGTVADGTVADAAAAAGPVADGTVADEVAAGGAVADGTGADEDGAGQVIADGDRGEEAGTVGEHTRDDIQIQPRIAEPPAPPEDEHTPDDVDGEGLRGWAMPGPNRPAVAAAALAGWIVVDPDDADDHGHPIPERPAAAAPSVDRLTVPVPETAADAGSDPDQPETETHDPLAELFPLPALDPITDPVTDPAADPDGPGWHGDPVSAEPRSLSLVPAVPDERHVEDSDLSLPPAADPADAWAATDWGDADLSGAAAFARADRPAWGAAEPAFPITAAAEKPLDDPAGAVLARQVEAARRHLQAALVVASGPSAPQQLGGLLTAIEQVLTAVTDLARETRGLLESGLGERTFPGEARFLCSPPWEGTNLVGRDAYGDDVATPGGLAKLLRTLGYEAHSVTSAGGMAGVQIRSPRYSMQVALVEPAGGGRQRWSGALEWVDESGANRTWAETLGPVELEDEELARRVDELLRRSVGGQAS